MNSNRQHLIVHTLIVLIIMFASIPVLWAAEEQPHSVPSPGPDNLTDDCYDFFFYTYQPYLENISAYNPMYFLFGTNPKNSMFQFSFKYKFIKNRSNQPSAAPWYSKIYFAYTQTSFWDLKSESMPFDDTSYKPELFFLSSNYRGLESAFAGFFLQMGARHESNGQSAELSRSTNTVYIKPIMIFYNKHSEWGLQIAPRLCAYFNNDNDTNPDLKDYRGFMNLQVKFGKADNVVVDNHIWTAREGISFQTDITYPLNRHIPTSLDIYFQAQYSNRLAERLRDYQERTEVFRLGFAVIR